MREYIFISHANPADNDFTKWLYCKLTLLGYKVWCDIFKLKGGEDFWKDIEEVIRNDTIKFLFVLSNNSNHREGTSKEITTAEKTNKTLDDKRFIIPLHIDRELSHDDVNIDLLRINSINFKDSWVEGLKALKELFIDDRVPVSSEKDKELDNIINTLYNNDYSIIEKEEQHSSNWFPIISIPEKIYFHRFEYAVPADFKLEDLPYPVTTYKKRIVTFAGCYDFVDDLPKTNNYLESNTDSFNIADILSEDFNSRFIKRNEAKNIIMNLLKKGFDKHLSKKIEKYELTNDTAFWIKKGVLDKDKYDNVLLIGKQKDKNWHFGISGNLKMFPEPVFVIKSHIFFTSDGKNLIESTGIQHSSRRRQGKNWWNEEWRKKIDAVINYLSENNEICIDLGKDCSFKISNVSCSFTSNISYKDPSDKKILEEIEDDIANSDINFEAEDNEGDSD